MGNSQQKNQYKDQYIEMFIELNRPYYIAGEYVDGYAYLIAHKHSQYSKLELQLIGREYVYWEEKIGIRRKIRKISNTSQNYQSSFQLKNFHGKLSKGQYSFPFSFLLPNMMSGSFYQSNHCFIKYSLRLQLSQSMNDKKKQSFQININIVEPPRIPLGGIVSKSNNLKKCCGCCRDYGEVRVALASDKNFVTTGDMIEVSAIVDNSNGSIKLRNGRINFEQWITKISPLSEVKNEIIQSSIVKEIGEVEKKKNIEFQLPYTIPTNLNDYTAIGKITARYFILNFLFEYGCRKETVSTKLHLIVHSKKPRVIIQMQAPKPANWDPKVFAQVTCESMKPFMNEPHRQITFTNLGKKQFFQTVDAREKHPVSADRFIHGYNGKKQQNNLVPPNLQFYTSYQPNYFNNPYDQLKTIDNNDGHNDGNNDRLQ